MEFTWIDYNAEYGTLVDSWLDETAVAMTGLDMGWDHYWNAVLADAVNFPGCKDVCKLVSENGVPIAAICFGCYQSVATVSEILVAPMCRGMGYGPRILQELVTHADVLLGERCACFTAVIFPKNVASQRAFLKAGFVFDHAHEDGTVWYYSYRNEEGTL